MKQLLGSWKGAVGTASVALLALLLACNAGPHPSEAACAFGLPSPEEEEQDVEFRPGTEEKVRQPGETRVVYLAGQLAEEDLIAFSAAVAAREPAPVLLLDTPGVRAHLKRFLTAYQADQVVPVGSFADANDLARRLGVPLAPALFWKPGEPGALWEAFFPQAEKVVVCPAQPRGLLLHAACLAGTARAPLFVTRGNEAEAAELRRRVAACQAREVLAIGGTAKLCRGLEGVKVNELAGEADVAKEALRRQVARGKIETLVVANPADANLSRLAPWLAVQKRSALLLTNNAGNNVAGVVGAALKDPDLRRADSLIFLADLKAIPTLRRPNPAAGKDTEIEMEPLTPEGQEPFTFATGRLFHQDAGVIALTLARQHLLANAGGPRKALVASNPGNSLPLLETFSRNTAKELANRGYETTALFQDEVNGTVLRRLLPEQDVFLWEGHYKTLVENYEMPKWNEPLRPSLVFLQSCLALNEAEAAPLLQRGAVAVVGSATRNYSASGGAFSLAFFDATLYNNQSLGGSLRQAKNFLLAYTLLKQVRLGDKATLSGANLRSSWAFTLWGDPTLKLPAPEPPRDALPAAGCTTNGDTFLLTRPEKSYAPVTSGKYTARMCPNARLAGLLTEDEDSRRLTPFFFAEVRLSPPSPGQTPRLRSKVNARNWTFLWDARLERGYLLAVPGEREELQFRVTWEE
jgi:hypothetical protein